MRKGKICALVTCLSLLFSVTVGAADFTSAITALNIDNSGNVSMSVNKSSQDSGKGIVAVYDTSGQLKSIAVSDEVRGEGEKPLTFSNTLNVPENAIVKAFLWKTDNGMFTLEPLTDTYMPTGQPTFAPIQTDTPVTEGYKATFVTDSHVTVTVSDTQDFTNANENVTEAYARSSATGEVDTSGDGQVNFMVVLEEGYEVDSVTVTPANYKNLKLPAELGANTYRITKITGDITVSITTKEAAPAPTIDPNSTPAPGDGIIHLNGTSINADGVENVTISGTTATITAAGTYDVEGTLTDGQIKVVSASPDDEIIVNLNNVNVTNTSDDAFKATSGKVTLVPAADTENTFSASADSACGIYSKNDLAVKGEGKITANSALGNGIRCKDDLEIGVCDLYVNAGNNGIKGDNSVKITKKNKSVTVVSGGDGIKSDKEPELVTDATTGETVVEGGNVTINGGVINITANTITETDGTISNGDGIQADMLLTIAGGTINITAAGEAIKANASSVAYLEDSTLTSGTPAEGDGCVLITGGKVTASAGEDAIKAVKNVTISDTADITVTKAQEGIQVSEIIYDTDGTTVLCSVEGEIDINGGTLDITCSEDGIQCGTGNVVITAGNITVNSTMDCIQGENITNISGGTFDLTAYGGAPETVSESNPEATDSCKGVKAGNLVYISGGTFDIDTYGDAIHSNNTVRILGGNITAASGDDGVHGDCYLYITDNADINVTKSYEGIEAAKIYVQGGETRVVSSDDGANAAGDEPTGEALDLTTATLSSVGSIELFAGPGGTGGPNWGGEDSSTYGYLEVSGGLLYIEAEGDGFDSNGDGVISGGTVLVNGPTSGGNGVFDVGDNGNTLKVTGGIVIGAGTSDMAVTPTSSTNSQYYVVTSSRSSSGGGMGGPGQQPGSSTSGSLSSQSAGKVFKLTDSSGNEIATYVPSKSYSWVLVSTPDMASGSYTLNYGGSVSGGTYTGKDNYGLVTGGTYSGSSTLTLTATQ